MTIVAPPGGIFIVLSTVLDLNFDVENHDLELVISLSQ